jgi:hypothetical protein
MVQDHSGEPSKRHGAASTALLIAVLLAAGLGVAAYLWLAPSRSPHAIESGNAVSGTRAPAHDTPLTPAEREAPRVPTPMDPPAPALGENRFDGRGRIHGEVLAGKTVTFPKSWTLVIEPSPTLIGSEHAVTKRVEFQAGEREFDVGDLPLAGYRVRAEAPGLNCTDVSALLIKGSEVVFATLQFLPSGFIDGRVLARDGVPADGVDIVLESSETKVRRALKSDANGQYVFKDVTDGAYKLYFGAPETPLVPPGDILFHAPSLRFKETTLPATGVIALETRAENGSPLANVDVSGFGSMGGALRTRTDFQGRARIAWLPPGEFRLEAQTDDGRRGRVTVSVTADADADAIIHLR